MSPYPYLVTEPITFRDLDAMGHVNNAVYFTWFETARTNYLGLLLAIDHPSRLPVILAETSCRYLAPGNWGDTVTIGCGISRFGGRSFDMVYRVAAAGRVLATGASVLVYYDYAKQRSIPVPDSFRAQVMTRQGNWRPDADD